MFGKSIIFGLTLSLGVFTSCKNNKENSDLKSKTYSHSESVEVSLQFFNDLTSQIEKLNSKPKSNTLKSELDISESYWIYWLLHHQLQSIKNPKIFANLNILSREVHLEDRKALAKIIKTKGFVNSSPLKLDNKDYDKKTEDYKGILNNILKNMETETNITKLLDQAFKPFEINKLQPQNANTIVLIEKNGSDEHSFLETITLLDFYSSSEFEDHLIPPSEL